MNIEISFTDENMYEDGNKILVFIKNGKLHISNLIDPDSINFFKDLIPENMEIVIFEHNTPTYPHCKKRNEHKWFQKSKT